MNRKFLIAVDSGKHTTKAVMKTEGVIQKVKFRTKVAEVHDLGVEIFPNTHLIKFGNKNYLIGDMLSEEKTDYELSKQTLGHKLCIYTAIARVLEKSKESIAFADVDLAINIPLNLYKNEQKKKEFSEFIQNNGQLIGLEVNGKAFSFRINSVLLLPEALGTIYQKMDEYRNKRVLVVDIGSLNTSYLEFYNLIPQYERMAVSNLGVNILRGQIAETLSTRYGTMITDDVVQQIFQDGYLYLNGEKQEESRKLIETMIDNHVHQILNYAKSRKISFANTFVVFVGGGSLLLKDAIKQQLPFAMIAPDAQFANVITFLTVLEAKVNGKA